MADSDEDKTTLGQDTPDATDDQPVDKPDENTPPVEEDDKDDQSRRERREERYVDLLANKIKSTPQPVYEDNLFKPSEYEPLEFKEGAEYDPAQLEEDRKAVSANKLAEGVDLGFKRGMNAAQAIKWETNFMMDAKDVKSEYGEKLDPKIEKAVVQDYIAASGITQDAKGRLNIANPNINFKEFFDKEMDKMETYAALARAESSDNVAKQAAKGAIRPTTASKPTKGDHGFDPNDPVRSVARMTSEQYHELGGKEASDAYLAERGLAPK